MSPSIGIPPKIMCHRKMPISGSSSRFALRTPGGKYANPGVTKKLEINQSYTTSKSLVSIGSIQGNPSTRLRGKLFNILM
eukprot:4674735-Amphidinium_carterae.1